MVKPGEYNIGSLTFMPLLSKKKKFIQSVLLPYYDGAGILPNPITPG